VPTCFNSIEFDISAAGEAFTNSRFSTFAIIYLISYLIFPTIILEFRYKLISGGLILIVLQNGAS